MSSISVQNFALVLYHVQTAECRVAVSLLRVPILFPFALGQLRLCIVLCLVELLGHDSTSIAVVVVFSCSDTSRGICG